MTTRNSAMLAPRIGLGTWQMGNTKSTFDAEVAALKIGIEMGATVIDTAEMYASGGAEEVSGAAIRGQREKVYLVTKVLPSNASYQGTLDACERSLRRLDTDFIDLYLLHWHSSYPLAGTIDAFEKLRSQGKIKQWGVSNFDTEDMEDIWDHAAGGHCSVNQIYYSLGERGAEFDLLSAQTNRDVATMAYCPLDQGRLVNNHSLQPLADKHDATIAQIALAWCMLKPDVIPIPKSSKVSRTIENVNARNIVFDSADLDHLDSLFPPPTRKTPLMTS